MRNRYEGRLSAADCTLLEERVLSLDGAVDMVHALMDQLAHCPNLGVKEPGPFAPAGTPVQVPARGFGASELPKLLTDLNRALDHCFALRERHARASKEWKDRETRKG